MWDCKYKVDKDHCRKRKNVCWPGARDCVLKGKVVVPFQKDLKAKRGKKAVNRRTKG